MQVVQAGAWLKDDKSKRIRRREANHKEREKRQKNRPLRYKTTSFCSVVFL